MNTDKDREKKTVFIVEDDEFVSEVYKEKLSLEGFRVMLEGDGSRVVESLRKDRPDIVLLDLVVPGKDGFQILQEIREDERLRSLPVIVMSNLSQDQDIARAAALGASEYVVKANVSLDQMAATVRKHLSAK